jgi:hypothetical protein
MLEPKVAKSKTDIVEPIFAKYLTDRLLPKCKKSKTLQVFCIMQRPWMESVEPKRVMLLKLRLDPKLK